MDEERNRRALLEGLEAYNEREFDTMAAHLANDFVYDQIPEELGLGHDKNAFLNFLKLDVEAFPDERLEVLDTVAEGDLVAFRAW